MTGTDDFLISLFFRILLALVVAFLLYFGWRRMIHGLEKKRDDLLRKIAEKELKEAGTDGIPGTEASGTAQGHD